MTYKIAFYIMVCILIIFSLFWCKKPPVTSHDQEIDQALNLTFNHLKNSSIISTGVNSKTGKLSVVDYKGDELKPCAGGSFIVNESYTDAKQSLTKSKTQDTDCSVIAVTDDPDLLSAMNASNSNVNGFIMKDGKQVPATFVVTVTAIYTGSVCTTIQNDQNQYTLCLKEGLFCDYMFNMAKIIAKREHPDLSEEEILQLILPDLRNAGCAE